LSETKLEEPKSGIDEIATLIMKLERARRGQTPEPQDAISNLVNVKNYMERSRYPTYTILQLVVYFETGYKIYGESARSLHTAAKTLSEALIEYKGLGRGEWVEAVMRAAFPEQTSFYFGKQEQKQERRRFWQRKPKADEPSEFQET